MVSEQTYPEMPNDANIPTNKRWTSEESGGALKAWWRRLLSPHPVTLLLWGGLFFLLSNCAIFFGVDTRPSAWLYYLNMCPVPINVPVSIVLWVIVAWLALESTGLFEDYLPVIRISTVVLTLLMIIFALRSLLGITSPDSKECPLWLDIAITVAVCCVVRSSFLLYDYKYVGKEFIDLEEAKWFWGLSVFIFIIVASLVVMHLIPVRTQVHAGTSYFVSVSLLRNCYYGLQELIRTWQGSLALRAFGISIIIISVAFFYVAGKWGLAYWSKIKDE